MRPSRSSGTGRQAVALISALVVHAAGVRATTIVVDTTVDDVAANGNCTLREATIAANGNTPVDLCPGGAASPVVDRIELPAGTFALTLQLANVEDASAEGDLDLTEEVEIVGAGMNATVIDGQATERVIHVVASGPGSAKLLDLEIRNGKDNGGAGALSAGTVWIERCRVSDNTTEFAPGGGIYQGTGGNLFLYDSDVVGNHAESNSAGGIAHVSQYAAFIERTTIRGNTATGGAGGMSAGGPIDLRNVTFSGNTAGLAGGALGVSAGGNSQYRVMSSVTFVGNHSGSGFGAAINAAGSGLILQFGSTILAGNTGGATCTRGVGVSTVSTGSSFESPGNSCGLAGTGDAVNVAYESLGLAPLDDNGGWAPTHGLFPESVAVDTAATCPPVDQRGLPRDDGACDAGALELQTDEDFHEIFGADGEAGFDDGTFGDWIVVNGGE